MSPKSGCYYEYNNTEWKDQLTHFEYYDATSGGDDYIISDLTYDAAGNVASFNGQTYIWNANRQLESATNSEEQQLLRYSYNENGYLTRVDIYEDNGATFVGTMGYVWDGDKLISRCIVDYQTGENITARVIYDTDGEAIGTTIEQDTEENDTDEIFLLYRKNLQGDVTGLIDPVSGQLVASYTYDAYGYPSIHPVNDKPLSVLSSWLYISLIPQMYRGYIYTFVGGEICYYLGSRFYSPQLGRFLNADKHFDTGTGVLGTNMFAYCNNNPVMYVDPTGEVTTSFIITAMLVAVIVYTHAYNFLLCLRLYQWGFTHRQKGKTYDMTTRWRSMLIDRLENSTIIKNLIKEKIKTMNNHNIRKITSIYTNFDFYSYGKEPNWGDFDLAVSIGGVEDRFIISIQKTSQRNSKGKLIYRITCELRNESFNFEDWSIEGAAHSDNPFIYALNQTGFHTQDKKLFVEFKWTFRISFNYS